MDFAPTALKGDSSEVVPVHFDSIQVRWVTAAARYQIAAKSFDSDEGTWRAHPPPSGLAKTELQPFLTALNAYEQTLANQPWPLVPQSDINELMVAFRQDGAALTALANADPKPLTYEHRRPTGSDPKQPAECISKCCETKWVRRNQPGIDTSNLQ